MECQSASFFMTDSCFHAWTVCRIGGCTLYARTKTLISWTRVSKPTVWQHDVQATATTMYGIESQIFPVPSKVPLDRVAVTIPGRDTNHNKAANPWHPQRGFLGNSSASAHISSRLKFHLGKLTRCIQEITMMGHDASCGVVVGWALPFWGTRRVLVRYRLELCENHVNNILHYLLLVIWKVRLL